MSVLVITNTSGDGPTFQEKLPTLVGRKMLGDGPVKVLVVTKTAGDGLTFIEKKPAFFVKNMAGDGLTSGKKYQNLIIKIIQWCHTYTPSCGL